MRNRQMIVHWLMANTTAIERAARATARPIYVMTDPKAFRDGVGRLLAEVQRIKGEGDYDAARALFDTYGVHFDPALRDEVVARVDHLQLPSYTGFVMPKLEAVTDAMPARSPTSTISYPLDLTTQMLEYSAATRHLRYEDDGRNRGAIAEIAKNEYCSAFSACSAVSSVSRRPRRRTSRRSAAHHAAGGAAGRRSPRADAARPRRSSARALHSGDRADGPRRASARSAVSSGRR